MPVFNHDKFEEAAESKGAGQERRDMVPGCYMCRVQAIRTEWTDSRGTRWTSADKSYVKVILDVDEGECAGKFSDEYWDGEEKDYGHTLYMSWTDRALGMLKHTFAAFDEANPGFDSRAAFEADKWEQFVGRRLRVSWDGREYTGRDGSTKCSVRPNRAITSDESPRPRVELQSGGYEPYEDWLGRTSYANARTSAPQPYDDVPFS